ncbi:hypothetical protein [Thermococcus nautili]|uniref:hypothetical protein n=1 Tax=Thermococcus nautili TaxID=195522 RepID=UPI002552E241|nr:hypothetical protein [Thermococcus nautili]
MTRMWVGELITAGRLEDAETMLRSVNRAGLDEMKLLNYTHNVVELALAFLQRDGLDRAVNTVLSLIDAPDDISWGLERIFEEYLVECTPERARRVWRRVHLIPEPEKKVEVLLKVLDCLDGEEERRKVLSEAFGWALRVRGRSWRTYMLSRVLYRVHDLEYYDLMLELCRRIRWRERRLVFEDFLFEDENAETCEEFVETLRKRLEASENALDTVIEVHLKYEKELLRAKGLNPGFYRLLPWRTPEGVIFYAVPKPLYPLAVLYLRLRSITGRRRVRVVKAD